LFRAKNNVITKIAGTNSPALGNPTGFAINDSGQVAFEMAAGANGSSVFRGPGGLFGRLIGTGSVLFGRTVAFAHIDRGGLNSTNQIAVWIIFTDGSEMIARGDPVNRLDPIVSTGAVQLTTALGRRVSVDAPIVAPQGRATLSFDVTFLTADGELNVKVGDTGGRTISASQPGVRQHIVVPLDPGTGGREPGTNHLTSLAFTLSGKAGATAQLSSVMVPGLFADQMDAGALSRWHVNSSDGGDVAVVSTARLPVAVRISPSNPPTPSRVTVATLSSRDFDAGEDLDRGSLRVVGLSPRAAQDSARSGAPACEVRDVNGDKLNDLVCQLEADAVKPQQQLRVEAMTRFGWGIAGAGVLRASPSASAK
jgi:hypothetical protein